MYKDNYIMYLKGAVITDSPFLNRLMLIPILLLRRLHHALITWFFLKILIE